MVHSDKLQLRAGHYGVRRIRGACQGGDPASSEGKSEIQSY